MIRRFTSLLSLVILTAAMSLGVMATPPPPHVHSGACYSQFWGNWSREARGNFREQYQSFGTYMGYEEGHYRNGSTLPDVTPTWFHYYRIIGDFGFNTYYLSDNDPRPDLVRLVKITYNYTTEATYYNVVSEVGYWQCALNTAVCSSLPVMFTGQGVYWYPNVRDVTYGYVTITGGAQVLSISNWRTSVVPPQGAGYTSSYNWSIAANPPPPY